MVCYDIKYKYWTITIQGILISPEHNSVLFRSWMPDLVCWQWRIWPTRKSFHHYGFAWENSHTKYIYKHKHNLWSADTGQLQITNLHQITDLQQETFQNCHSQKVFGSGLAMQITYVYRIINVHTYIALYFIYFYVKRADQHPLALVGVPKPLSHDNYLTRPGKGKGSKRRRNKSNCWNRTNQGYN